MPPRNGPALVASFPNGSYISHPLDVVDGETVRAWFELVGVPRDAWVVEEGE